jgi:hypothetical protein
LPVVVADNKTGGLFLKRPRWRETAGSQKGALLIGINVRLPPWRRETPMADLHKTANLQSKERVNAADFAFVAFVVIITAIPVLLTLTQIYLQNPR